MLTLKTKTMKQKLIEVLSIQSYSHEQFRMFRYIIGQVKQMGCSYYVHEGNIYVTKGDADLYPCVASHMDTVHEIVEDLHVLEMNGNLTGFNRHMMEQTGIGGDDKVGIFVALQCLDTFANMKAVFFRDEEVGCMGSYEADVPFFNDCSFVLQCDRRGNTDFVTNASGIPLSGDDFQADVFPIINSYGYKFSSGMMTDVMALKEMGILCAMANISCGYYNPHMAQEFVNIDDVMNVLDMVKDIIMSISNRQYICKYSKPKQYVSTYGASVKTKSADYYDDYYKSYSKTPWYDDFDKADDSPCLCEDCGNLSKPDEMQYLKAYEANVCPSCFEQYGYLNL